MNKVELMGRLVADPEYRVSTGENMSAVANYRIAVNRKFTKEGQPTADFFRCVSFGKQAEIIDKYFKKGSRICVVGRLQNNNYTTQSGEKRYNTDIYVEEIDFVDTKKETEAMSSGSSSRGDNDFVNVPEGIEDELPFN